MSISYVTPLETQQYFMTLAHRIAAGRRELGFTQTEMAKLAGTSLSTYRKIENGDATVAAETLYRVIKTLKTRLHHDLFVDPV